MNTDSRHLLYMAGGGVKQFCTAPATITGTWKAIYFCRNSQLTSLIATDITNDNAISSKTSFAAGTCFTGNITKVKSKGGAFFLIN